MPRGSEPRPAGTPPASSGAWEVEAEAPAKLNLGLEIVGRRPDGYHDLRTVFQAIDLADRLRLRSRREPGIRLRVEGPEAVPAGADNLVVRAGELLARRRAPGRGAEVLLTKRIPAGAGLGGGSSDAAATLLGLERLWGLDPDPAGRAALALELGSDVPFFLLGGTALGEGRGEILTPVPPPPPTEWLLALPDFRISTAEAFRRLSPSLTGTPSRITILLSAFKEGDLRTFVENLQNDLEVGVVRIQPRLASIRAELLAEGALAVGLTGSGSVLYALTGPQGTAKKILDRGATRRDYRLIPCHPVDYGARVVPGTHGDPRAPRGGRPPARPG